MRRSVRWLALLVVATFAAGCAAEGAGTGNFSLAPQKKGWYAGDEAHFVLTLSSDFFHANPEFVVDRHFALEEVQLEEEGLTFGGDFSTRDPDAVGLRLERDGRAADEFTMNGTAPSVDVYLTIPDSLRDSSYTLSLKLFKVGWIKSDVFRVDHR